MKTFLQSRYLCLELHDRQTGRKIHNSTVNLTFSPLQLNFQRYLRGSFHRDVPQPSLTCGLPHHQSRHYSHKRSGSNRPHANALCHFHIAASINPATGPTRTHHVKDADSIVMPEPQETAQGSTVSRPEKILEKNVIPKVLEM